MRGLLPSLLAKFTNTLWSPIKCSVPFTPSTSPPVSLSLKRPPATPMLANTRSCVGSVPPINAPFLIPNPNVALAAALTLLVALFLPTRKFKSPNTTAN